MLAHSMDYFTYTRDLDRHNERTEWVHKIQGNLAMIGARKGGDCMYEASRCFAASHSFKLNYRKAQICLNSYHELIGSGARKMPYRDIHDSYDIIYYHPN